MDEQNHEISDGDADCPETDNEHSRRDLLRKAAVGFGVAAGVWVAPKIEGLSLTPDYAAAGTVRGTFNIKRTQTPCPGGNNCWGACNCNSATVPATIGGEPISITWAGKADVGGSGTANVDFSSMDPPFNSNCKVTAVTGNTNCCLNPFRPGAITNNSASWDFNNDFFSSGQGNDVTITIVC